MKHFIPILALPLLCCSVAMESAPNSIEVAPSEKDNSFDQVGQLYRTFKNEPDPKLKMGAKVQIVTLLNHLLKVGGIDNANRAEAIQIAEGIEAVTLAIRLQEASAKNPFTVLPQELIDYIIALAVEGNSVEQIKEMLVISKGFNKLFLKTPIKLSLTFKKISDDTLMKIVSIFPGIVDLDLAYTQVTDAGLAYISGLTNLTKLDLAHTQITDAGLVHLRGLTNLDELSLINTRITDAGLEHLSGLTKLTYLALNHTSVTREGYLKLKKEIPNCEISASFH